LMATFDRAVFEGVTGLSRWDAAALDYCFNVPSSQLASLMRSMARELAAPDFATEAAVSGLAHVILAELARTFARRQSCASAGLTPWQMRKIERHLNLAQGRWPTCAELAQLCGISTGHLSRSFRATVGLTLSDFAAEIRMERAKALLAAGELSLQQIAAALGFNSPSSFSFAFRRHVGATPRDFRQKTRCGQAVASPLAA
jgi:AraC family transcriptional regulator